jgi:hypothetical protein
MRRGQAGTRWPLCRRLSLFFVQQQVTKKYEISYFPTIELTAKIEIVIRQRLSWAARLEGSKMSYSEQAFAEAIGRKILASKGSRLVELLYFLEEEKTLELLRGFSALGRSEQAKILELLKAASSRRPVKGRTVTGVQPGG